LIEWILCIIGSIGFLAAHIVMISYFDIDWSRVPVWTPVCAISCIALCIRLLPRLQAKKISQKYVTMYYFILQVTYLFAIMRASALPV
jgi:uncharacterized protein (DUF983 family)